MHPNASKIGVLNGFASRNELIADVFAAADSDATNGLSVEECMDCLESCGIRATGKQMPLAHQDSITTIHLT